jgi:hypothetical protein
MLTKKKELTHDEVLAYFNKHDDILITTPDGERYELGVAEFIDNEYVFGEYDYEFRNPPAKTFAINAKEVLRPYEDGGIIYLPCHNGDKWVLTALVHEDVSESFSLDVPDDELADDDLYKKMWKRASAIEDYISNKLFITEHSTHKIECYLHAELDLEAYRDDISGDLLYPYYHYEFRLCLVNRNHMKYSEWNMRNIRVALDATNEKALILLTRELLDARLSMEK